MIHRLSDQELVVRRDAVHRELVPQDRVDICEGHIDVVNDWIAASDGYAILTLAFSWLVGCVFPGVSRHLVFDQDFCVVGGDKGWAEEDQGDLVLSQQVWAGAVKIVLDLVAVFTFGP